jgi:hypothetical protein
LSDSNAFNIYLVSFFNEGLLNAGEKSQAVLKIVIGYYLVEHSTLANEKRGSGVCL